MAKKLYLPISKDPENRQSSNQDNAGQMGERYAARYLEENGYKMIAIRERDHRGEIDIIAKHLSEKTIVFVEVKTLRTSKPGHPAERVDRRKQRQITHAALRYLKRNHQLEFKARFDIIAIRWPHHEDVPSEIQHFISAFESVDDYQIFG